MGKLQEILKDIIAKDFADKAWKLHGLWAPSWKMGIMEAGTFYPLASLNSLNAWNWDEKNVEYYLKLKPADIADLL